MAEYLIQDRTMTVLADQTRRIAGGTDALSGADILEILSKVNGEKVEGSKYLIRAIDNRTADNSTCIKSGYYDDWMIFALPTKQAIDSCWEPLQFQKWLAPVSTVGGFMEIGKFPVDAGCTYTNKDGYDILIQVYYGTSDDLTFTIESCGVAGYRSGVIDWGDGTIETNSGSIAGVSHTYSSIGGYIIKIRFDDVHDYDYIVSHPFYFHIPEESASKITVLSFSPSVQPDHILINANLRNVYSINFADGVRWDYWTPYSMENVSSIIIPSSVDTLGEYDLYFPNLKYLVISNGVKHISANAFRYCMNNLETIVLPSTIETIADSAFHNDGSANGKPFKTLVLTGGPNLQIGNIITYYGNFSNLVIAYRDGVIPLVSAQTRFSNVGKPNIYVSDSLVDAYKADETWSYYVNYIKPISEFVP